MSAANLATLPAVKACGGCGEVKPLNDYHRNRSTKDGRQHECRTCRREQDRRRREASPDAARERVRRWKAENREAVRESMRRWRAENREAELERARRYWVEHPEKRWENNYRQRVRQFGFEPVVVPFTRADLVAAYGDACWHCGGPFEHLDHYPVPVKAGGPHTLENVRPSCAACNLRRGANSGAEAVDSVDNERANA